MVQQLREHPTMEPLEPTLELNEAVHAGDTTTVHALLSQGVDINALDDNGCSALAFCQEVNLLKVLLDAGADPNAAPKGEGPRPLFWACETGRIDIARVLIETGASFEAELMGWGDTSDWQSSLHAAVEKGDTAFVSLLLDSGASCLLNAFDYVGRTPLAVAVEAGLQEIAKLLLDAGADVNAEDENGLSEFPITIAAGCQGIEMIRLLLNAGAKLPIRDELPCIALEAAKRREDELRDSAVRLITEHLDREC